MRKLCIVIGMLWLCVTSCGDSYESSKIEKNVNGLPVGYAGLVIGQSVFSEGNTYVAYDAACPVEASRNVSVEVLEDGLGTAECPKCHTQYNLSSGGFPTGEGTEYLKHYKVTVSGTSLQVRN